MKVLHVLLAMAATTAAADTVDYHAAHDIFGAVGLDPYVGSSDRFGFEIEPAYYPGSGRFGVGFDYGLASHTMQSFYDANVSWNQIRATPHDALNIGLRYGERYKQRRKDGDNYEDYLGRHWTLTYRLPFWLSCAAYVRYFDGQELQDANGSMEIGLKMTALVMVLGTPKESVAP